MENEHEKHMKRALELAEHGRGRTSPNPMVGAVITLGGETIAEGWHRKAGEPHAEINALRAAGGKAAGATMYVNLEPCSHHGRTPPCAPAVAAAGIARVVVGMTDPNPKVSGAGIGFLKNSGVETIVGVLEKDCLRLNEAFVKVMSTGLPFVILKAAVTLDGKTASRAGDSKWISCEASREMVHRMRGEADAVAVGAGTLRADDPALNCRLPESEKIKDPLRVALDPELILSVDSKLARQAVDGKTVVFTLEGAPADRAEALRRAGCRVIELPPDGAGMPDLRKAMLELAGMGVLSVLLEGGGTLNASMIEAGLVDRVAVFIAPKLLGGADAKTFFDGAGFPRVEAGVKLSNMSATVVGDDILIQADVAK
ncbi:MAG: Riboflavin biosynthesis protein RibD [bacterium ADurb.Bin236]|nr:MAG: Riboflavin biosynthesis protein RibD [bacterium ADurb.Bin236]HOY64624.1 bifunctional diaminohydroxyphosphoribosylaminopyrimidine deaminase/5-amino-6-(5-phosphoribosylamino)uracil reductase RibD [bacterium]HPN95363.1 bifunctional diaminohydroxyphosphoribosylaminopyrimidine deaminase/5-amino-6-(5-phosphoribosylamino)uracil reductase RibD [bacterium]